MTDIDATLCLNTMYCIWHFWNQAVFRQTTTNVLSLFTKNLAITVNYADSPKSEDNSSRNNLRKIWVSPQLDVFKINTDAVVNKLNQKYATGFICRNHEGNIIFASASIENHSYVISYEALAIKNVMILVINRMFEKFIIESDSKLVVDMCLGNATIFGHVKNQIRDIMTLVESGKAWNMDLKFQHVQREGNKAADWIVKYVIQCNNSFNWEDQWPTDLLRIVQMDYTDAE
ncbi:hypothetical protein Cni_G22385 [Canna indica]|uniref:RNase H type-1 domain-containing protein n=1 Tax=Canna indica TaxID=4628 RepID=A0AAQ3KRX6_9LILI|nr:hypothetical protein Cni_G22385 [Canna indica]